MSTKKLGCLLLAFTATADPIRIRLSVKTILNAANGMRLWKKTDTGTEQEEYIFYGATGNRLGNLGTR